MIMVFGSLKKGHKFELVVAKWLTKITGVPWQRIPMSGATATNNNLENWHGDVFTENPQYIDLVIEAKSYKKPVMLADINNPKSHLNEWINQTKKEAGDKFWLLFFKANYGVSFLLVPSTDDLYYAKDDSLHIIFKACKEVCRTKEYLVLQVDEEYRLPAQ
jgi:hypothetical protein